MSLRESGVGVTYAAPRATKTEAADEFDRLVEPMQMKFDPPQTVARSIWQAVERDRDTAYARGAESVFVIVERLLPFLVDRAIAKQMADKRVREYLGEAGLSYRR